MPLVHLWSLLSFLSSSWDPAPSHRGTPSQGPSSPPLYVGQVLSQPKGSSISSWLPTITCRSWSSQLPAPMHFSRLICAGVPLQLCFLTPELVPSLPQVPDLGDDACGTGRQGGTPTHPHPSCSGRWKMQDAVSDRYIPVNLERQGWRLRWDEGRVYSNPQCCIPEGPASQAQVKSALNGGRGWSKEVVLFLFCFDLHLCITGI